MRGVRRAVAALALLAASGVAAAAVDAPPDLTRLFPLEREVAVPQGGLVRLALPPDVLAATQPDLSDVRLFDAAGREVPYLIDTGAPRALVRRLDARVLEARRERVDREHAPPLYRETYVLEPPPGDAPAWALVFDVSQPQFLRRLVLEAVDAAGERRPLVADTALFRLDSPPAARLRVPLPVSPDLPAPARLAVTLEGEDGDFLGPRLAFETASDLSAATSAAVPLEVLGLAARDGRSVVALARPLGLVPDALRLETSTAAFTRQVEVWDERPGQAPAVLGAGSVARLRGASDAAAPAVALRAARGDRLRLEIVDGDSPPLRDLRVVALVRQPELVFVLDDAAGPARATLRYGGGRAFAPRYDLAALQPTPGAALDALAAAVVAPRDGPAAARAVLGAARDNPAYDGAPALGFAMRPGAGVDARRWTHRRALAVPDSPDGLTRLRLAAADLAPARPDFGDLRIVDAQGRQWPYLLQPDAARAWQSLDVAAPARAGGTSRYALRLPAPLPIDQLVLETDTAFVDRPFRLRGRTADGAEVWLADGRLTRRAERPQPLAIDFAPQRLSDLELAVDDGDEAPLAWRTVRARTIEPELFLVAPAGAYTLLLGDPDAAPPRYELDRVRDIVLAVRGARAAAGPLEANPRYAVGARLAGGDRLGGLLSRAALWGVLIAAVIVLGIVTMRTARR